MRRVLGGLLTLFTCMTIGPAVFAYTKPVTYDSDNHVPIFKDEYISSPHAWIIVKAIEQLNHDGYTQEAKVANRYLLPMLEGVTFNDVWGDADLAGASVLDYYVPYAPSADYGFGDPLAAYKNSTTSYLASPFYGYGNAAEHAQFRYDYGRRIYLNHWGDDVRDTMAGWVTDKVHGQHDPNCEQECFSVDGREYCAIVNCEYAVGTSDIDAQSRFGRDQTPASALLYMLSYHSQAHVVFPDQGDDALLSTMYLPTQDVFDQQPEWFDETFNDADDIEAFEGYDGHGSAWYANWTYDAGGSGPTCSGCWYSFLPGAGLCEAAPMLLRFPVDSKAHAFFQLGWAIHLLEDVTTPVHTIDDSLTTFHVHNDVEHVADQAVTGFYSMNGKAVRDSLPAHSLADFTALYEYPPAPSFNPDCASQAVDPSLYYQPDLYAAGLSRSQGEGVAHAYTRRSAEITNQFMPYIKCVYTELEGDWAAMGYFTAFGLDTGIKSTAGLIRQFIEDVDTTGPAITIQQPLATTYPHLGTLTLAYSSTDDESGVKTLAATLDDSPMLAGHGLDNGQAIDLLMELKAGDHVFAVTSTDNAGNIATTRTHFTIVVTPQSLMDEVRQFLNGGAITQDEGTSLLKKISAAAAYRAAGDCKDANAVCQAFINELMAQSGRKVSATAAAILIDDARYLMAHCP